MGSNRRHLHREIALDPKAIRFGAGHPAFPPLVGPAMVPGNAGAHPPVQPGYPAALLRFSDCFPGRASMDSGSPRPGQSGAVLLPLAALLQRSCSSMAILATRQCLDAGAGLQRLILCPLTPAWRLG